MSTPKRTGYVPYVQRESPEASPTTEPISIRSDPGSRWASPAPQLSSYSGWTPALAPIVGSPSIPPPRGFPDLEEDTEPELSLQDNTATVHEDIEQGFREKEMAGEDELHIKPKTRGFTGGLLTELRKIPAFMMKNNPRGSGYGGEASATSPRLSYYSSASSSVRNSPIPSQITQPHFPPPTIEEAYESDYSPPTPSSPAFSEPRTYQIYDATTAANATLSNPSVMSSPAQVVAEEVTDYEKTRSPYPFTNPDDKTLPSYADRIHRFLTDLYNLPWVSIQVANEYTPSDDSARGRYRKDAPTSWYTPRRSKGRKNGAPVAITITPASPSPPPMIHAVPPTPTLSGIISHFSRTTRSAVTSENRLTLTASQFTYAPTQRSQRSHSRAPSEGAVTAFRELRSPGIATTVSGAPSPGASSHGMGQHSISESFYYASPPQRGHRPYPSVTSVVSSPPQTVRVGSDAYYRPKY